MANYLGAIKLGVTDLDRTVAFYTSIFGMAVGPQFPRPFRDQVALTLDGCSSLILQCDPKLHPNEDRVMLVFYVADLQATMARALSPTATIVSPSSAVAADPSAVYSRIRDPDGYLIELLEL